MLKEFQFLFNRLPFSIILYATSRCNARCPHCFNYSRQDDALRNDELSLDEFEKISQNFNHIKVLTITGGEPFLRDDLSEIVQIFYKNNGVQYLSFHTNAFLTKRVYNTISEVLKKCPDIQVIVCISIDGIGESHEHFRGVKGGFEKILKTIAKLKELKRHHPNLNLISSTIFCHSTRNSFADTLSYIQNEIGGVKPSLSFIRGNSKEEKEKSIEWTAYRDYYRSFTYEVDKDIKWFSPMALKEAIEMNVNKMVVNNYLKKRQTVKCQAGQRLLVIYENGDVFPCETLEDNFGNLREVNYDVKRLLLSKKGNRIIRDITHNKCYCTWESILPINLLFSPIHLPLIIKEWLRLFILRKKNKG
jgi:MoaA/NifB/PqqE/SkfB family radical SAM enzyme